MLLLNHTRKSIAGEQRLVTDMILQGDLEYVTTGAGGIIFVCKISSGVVNFRNDAVKKLLVKYTPVDTDVREFVVLRRKFKFSALSAAEVKSEYAIQQHLYMAGIEFFKYEMCPMPVALVNAAEFRGLFPPGFVTVMEYVDHDSFTDEDIPKCRGLLMMMFKLRYLHGDLHKGNFLKKKNGQVIAIDFGRTVYITPEIEHLIRTNFAQVVGSMAWADIERDWHIVFVINLFLPYMMYKYSCHDYADDYFMYLFLITGTFRGIASPYVTCKKDFVEDFDYTEFRKKAYAIEYPVAEAIDAPAMPLADTVPLNEISRVAPRLHGGKRLKKLDVSKKVRRRLSKRRGAAR
jgi:hypothetical protein